MERENNKFVITGINTGQWKILEISTEVFFRKDQMQNEVEAKHMKDIKKGR